ncbi:Heat-shock protein [Tenacibaculum sp. 190524A02b]|uniref:Heat-shock protein n=1 Tax=Tenacibaculum vairaonense TaxID=3137860 RepID=A0ABP1F5H5_9FLAO
MARKQITAQKIIELYMDEVLMDGTSKTIYAFAKKHEFEENDFYQHFSSFETLEKEIFAIFHDKTIELLHNNEEYKTYDEKSKLLSFYYTFFELLTANRSYVHLKLKGNKNKLESVKLLSKLKEAHIRYIKEEFHSDKIDFKNEKVNKVRDKGMEETAWIQLLFALQFWLEDESKNFEKTDVFIEKAVKASFDLKDITPLKSVFDFAKFLWKEKMPV